MKTKVILTLCVVFVWGLVPNLSAQVVAGSPEDKAFQLIDAENNVDAKITKLNDFEKQYPQSKALREVYLLQMTIYQQKNDQTGPNQSAHENASRAVVSGNGSMHVKARTPSRQCRANRFVSR